MKELKIGDYYFFKKNEYNKFLDVVIGITENEYLITRIRVELTEIGDCTFLDNYSVLKTSSRVNEFNNQELDDEFKNYLKSLKILVENVKIN